MISWSDCGKRASSSFHAHSFPLVHKLCKQSLGFPFGIWQKGLVMLVLPKIDKWNIRRCHSDDYPPPPLLQHMKEWKGCWPCAHGRLLGLQGRLVGFLHCALLSFVQVSKWQQIIPLTWKWLSKKVRNISAAETVLVSYSFRFTIQAGAFDLWNSWFESYLLVRPLSPGLCWQSGLAGLYFVNNLVFKSERTSAEFSPGAGVALILEYVCLGVIRIFWLSR